jgi:SAM-dependent methyltransferase
MQSSEKWFLATPAWGLFARRVIVPWVVSFAELAARADVLDLGCGGGWEVEALAERFPGWRLIATDYDPDMVALARGRLAPFGDGVTVEQADATALEYADGSFDLVVAVLVWHHVGAWEKATAEVARVLRPGGRLLLADLLAPSSGGPTRNLFAHATYTLPALESALADAKFRRWRVRTLARVLYRLLAEKPPS